MTWQIRHGDALDELRAMPDESAHCCVTSPPYYGLRDYGGDTRQIGLEPTVDDYVTRLVDVFRELRRVLRRDGTLWLVLGDSFAGSWGAQGRDGQMADRSIIVGRQLVGAARTRTHVGSTRELDVKPKDLLGIPWQVAFALRADGWTLRADIVWAKANPMPESVTDRPTRAHEFVFLLSRSRRYYYDAAAIAEPRVDDRATDGDLGDRERNRGGRSDGYTKPRGIDLEHLNGKRNRRDVWQIASQPYPDAHFATFPPRLVEPMILAGCPRGGVVLDPFAGSGTVGVVALRHERAFVGIELVADYVELARWRIIDDAPLINLPLELAVT